MTTRTRAHFICPECSRSVTADVEVPDVDYGFDRLSESLSEDQAEVQCPSCGAVFDAWAQNSPSHCTIELSEHSDVDVQVDYAPFPEPEPEGDDWLNDEPSKAPFGVFMSTIAHHRSLLETRGTPSAPPYELSSLVRRMIFAHEVTAMEAYLGDALQNYVETSNDAIASLVDDHKKLATERVSLREVLDDPNVVRTRVLNALKGILYHNLPVVSVIYRIAAGIDISRPTAEESTP